MARARLIKPEFFEDPKVGQLSRDARLLYIGLWTLSDDVGNVRTDSQFVASRLFPYDHANGEVGTWLKELLEAERLIPYEHQGEAYAHIVNFPKHQKIERPSTWRNPVPQDKTLSTKARTPTPQEESRSTKPRRPEAGQGQNRKSVPNYIKKAVAARVGAVPGTKTSISCHYCKSPGELDWWLNVRGNPSWVLLSPDLEWDHLISLGEGGQTEANNLVIACRSCNRTKGATSFAPVGQVLTDEIKTKIKVKTKGNVGASGREPEAPPLPDWGKLERIKQICLRLDAHDLLDLEYWRKIDALTESSELYYDKSLLKYLAWWESKSASRRHKNRQKGFWNWVKEDLSRESWRKRAPQ